MQLLFLQREREREKKERHREIERERDIYFLNFANLYVILIFTFILRINLSIFEEK